MTAAQQDQLSQLVYSLQTVDFTPAWRASELISLIYELKRLFGKSSEHPIKQSSRYQKMDEALTKWQRTNSTGSVWSRFDNWSEQNVPESKFQEFSMSQRHQIICQILRIVRRPDNIYQGKFNTCNVAVVQNRLFSLHPALAASVIIDVVNNRHYSTWDNQQICMLDSMLSIDDEAKMPETESVRNLASMIFQRAAANIYWQRSRWTPAKIQVEPGSIIYHQSESISDGNCERLLDLSNDPPTSLNTADGRLINGPCLRLLSIMNIYMQIAKAPPPRNLVLTARATSISGYGISATLRTSAELHKELSEISRDGGFPVFADVPGHIFVIREYNEDERLVAVDNSYGSGHDFLGAKYNQPLKPLDDLFNEMSGSERMLPRD